MGYRSYRSRCAVLALAAIYCLVTLLWSVTGAQRAAAKGDATFLLLGSASELDEGVRLTPAEGDRVGGASLASKQYIRDGFEVTFQFQITLPPEYGDGMCDGADGLAFVIQNERLDALGGGGGGLGYHGLPNSLAIEFDTWENWAEDFPEEPAPDPNANHISVHSRGTGPNSASEIASLGSTTDIPNLSDCQVHDVRVRYVPGTLDVFLDDFGSPALSVAADLDAILSLDKGRAWFGFTAATGGVAENHDIVTFNGMPLEAKDKQKDKTKDTTRLAPRNDDFDRATAIRGLPYTESLDTSTATTAADDPACVGQGPTVWYKFTPTADTTVQADTFGSGYDTTLSVYTGSRGGLTQIACNDDAQGLQSQVVFQAGAGTTYYLMVGSFASGPGGNLVFSADEAPDLGIDHDG